MAAKSEPMEYEVEMEESFRRQAFCRGLLPKQIDLTDDQKVMLIPSPDEPYITGIFHRSADEMATRHNFNMLPSDIAAMQQEHNFYGGGMKSSPKQENGDEEYPTYTIARSEMELNSRSLPKKYKCKFCVYKTSYKSDLNRHLRRHAKKDNVYNCDICGLPFRSISKVQSHRQQVHMIADDDDLSLCCSMCPYRCAEKDIDLFQLHVQQHIEENTCNVCNKSFNNPQAVEKHKKIFHQVTNEVVFPPQARRSSGYFQNIAQDLPSTENQPRQGELVRQNDSSSASSRNNSNCSTPVPVSVAKQPCKGYNSNSSVVPDDRCVNSSRDINVNKTSGIKDRNDFSDKSLQQSKNLSDVKSPEMPISNIPEVPERGTNTVTKDVSKKPHENGIQEKKHSCEKCGEDFGVMRELFIHMSICLQDEINARITCYKCPICTFSTEALDKFSSHMVKHTIDKYSCDICNKPFSKFRNVLGHKRKIHKIDLRKRRSPTKLKTFSSNSVLSDKSETNSTKEFPYSKETIGQIQQLAEKEQKDPDRTEEVNVASVKNGDGSNQSEKSPISGRYTRLVSDFDDFMLKPFACSLCFFRTSDVNQLLLHVKNHISGCYGDAMPETVRFNFMPVSAGNSQIQCNETVYTLNISSKASPANQNLVIIDNSATNVMETGSVKSKKPEENQDCQIKKLDNLLKNSRKKRMFVSRSVRVRSVEKKPMSCEICHKEFSMRILAKRHMEKIHSIRKSV